MKFGPLSTRKRDRAAHRPAWNHLTLSSLSVMALSAVIPLSKPVWSPVLAPLFGSPSATINSADLNAAGVTAWTLSADSQSVDAVLQASEAFEREAIKRTEALSAQSWDIDTSEQEWQRIEALWKASARKLEEFISNYADSEQVEDDSLEKLRFQYHDHINRIDLTSAMHAYYKSVFLAEQPAEGSSAQCDVDASFADSPEQWAQVVALRKQSVQNLDAVARGVSFYDEQVVPLKGIYQEKLTWAGWIHQRSPWYYAIQKAVCATAKGEQATQSGDQEDWVQTAVLWQESIRLLEAAPKRIPVNIPNEYRDSYQAAEDNLELWKSNLQDAEARAVARR